MKMHISDKIIFGSVLCVFFPFLLSLIGIAIGFYFFNEGSIPFFFGAGIIAGIILDIIFVRRIMSVLFELPFWIFAAIYIMFSIFIYGMFMGLPVPELVMGIAAGYYWGRRIYITGIASSERESLIKKVPLFASLIMTLVCISSAFLALNEKTIGEELHNMLNLGFVPGKNLIISGIIIGGSALILIQYFITRIVILKTIKTSNGRTFH
jgi:hypothetical protein